MTTTNLNIHTIRTRAFDNMEQNISKKLDADSIYLHDEKDARELKQRYDVLPLPNCYKWVINDYCACTCSKLSRAIELAYLAGMDAAIQEMEPQTV